jgi:hypothetical protein
VDIKSTDIETCVNDKQTVFLEDLGSCTLAWKNPSRTHGCKWGLLIVRERETKGSLEGCTWSLPSEKACFSFSGAFTGRKEPVDLYPIINE